MPSRKIPRSEYPTAEDVASPDWTRGYQWGIRCAASLAGEMTGLAPEGNREYHFEDLILCKLGMISRREMRRVKPYSAKVRKEKRDADL